MEKLALYKKIREIASSLDKEGGVYTRADLAFDLEAYGFGRDSMALNILVWEAYKYYKDDKVIRRVFMDNRNLDSLADLGGMEDMMDNRDTEALFPVLYDRLQRGEDSLDALNSSVSGAAGGGNTSVSTGLMNAVVGTKGVTAVQQQASDIFSRYSSMIGSYHDARNVVSSLISDFTMLRAGICDIYRRYSAMLVDVFGESIKTVDPKLFDFDRMEWLDTHGMMQNVKLEYDKVVDKCKLLVGSISDSFRQSLGQSAGAYRAAGGRSTGLVVAGLNMFMHYAGAAQKTAELEQDLLRLKNIVKHDVTVIKGDMSRLTVIYKTMNDVFVPSSNAFFKDAGRVISSEWVQLEQVLYGRSEARKLKRERDEILQEMKELEVEMTDETSLIEFYSQRIAENQAVLESVKPQYDTAMATRPSRPSGLANVLSLGSSGKKYNRDIYEWDQNSRPVIDRYNDVVPDIKLDTDEHRQLKSSFEKNRMKYRKLRSRLSRINASMLKEVSADRDVQMSLLPHVESIIRLLRLGRQIAESGLDEKLMKKVSVKDISIDLPEDVRENVHTFVDAFREGLVADATCGDDPDVAMVGKAEDGAVQAALGIVQSYMDLALMEKQSAIATEEYDKELSRLQKSFRRYLPALDRQAERLLESLRKINTAENHEELKAGLLSLAGEDSSVFQGNDWDEFLKGNKTIEL